MRQRGIDPPILAVPSWPRQPYASNHGGGSFVRLTFLLAAFSWFYFTGTPAADEAGVSFWLPGQYGSFAAVPSKPGWSFESSYYHASAEASRGISFERGGAIQAGMKSPSDLFMFTPTYAFETPIFGAQAAFGTTYFMEKTRRPCLQRLPGQEEIRYRALDRTRSSVSAIYIRPFR
jgi:hypothetical protein